LPTCAARAAKSLQSAAATEFAAAKAELIRIRIVEKKRDLIPVDEATSNMEQLVGLFLTGLSGLSAWCGGRDLAVRRAIDKAVYRMRVEITKLAGQRGEPPLDDGT
jgi:hypothetical protein